MPIRLATEQDVPFILAIYNDVIATTTAVYAEQPVTLADRLAWFQSREAQDYPVLIAEDDFGSSRSTMTGGSLLHAIGAHRRELS